MQLGQPSSQLGIEHEVLDDQLAAALEQVERLDRAVRALELVVLVDRAPSAARGAWCSAHRVLWSWPSLRRAGRREPHATRRRGNLGQSHDHNFTVEIGEALFVGLSRCPPAPADISAW